MLPNTPISVRCLRTFLDFFISVDAYCDLTYLEHRPLVFLKGQLCRQIFLRTLSAGARRTNFLPLLHRLRPQQQLYLTDYLHSAMLFTFVSTPIASPSTFYIGSSIHTLFDRETSRARKYRQLCSGITAYYEPALRFLRRTRAFYQHSVIPL